MANFDPSTPVLGLSAKSTIDLLALVQRRRAEIAIERSALEEQLKEIEACIARLDRNASVGA